jgi:hypothetical protein
MHKICAYFTSAHVYMRIYAYIKYMHAYILYIIYEKYFLDCKKTKFNQTNANRFTFIILRFVENAK